MILKVTSIYSIGYQHYFDFYQPISQEFQDQSKTVIILEKILFIPISLRDGEKKDKFHIYLIIGNRNTGKVIQ